MLGGDWTDGTMTDFKWRHFQGDVILWAVRRSEEHTSELQSLMRNSYAVFRLKKKINVKLYTNIIDTQYLNNHVVTDKQQIYNSIIQNNQRRISNYYMLTR